jgi:hypothetical protein
MNRFQIASCLAIVVAMTTGCSRKPPQKFVAEKPALELPRIETGRTIPVTAELAAVAGAGAVIPAGTWTLGLERQLAIRSNTMATTGMTSTTKLKLRVVDAPGGEGSDVSVTDTEATVSALEDMPGLVDEVRNTYQSLTLELRRLSNGGISVRNPLGRTVPEELSDALQLMVPMFPAVPDAVGRAWELNWNRKFDLPGGTGTIENVHSSWKIAGMSRDNTIVYQDFSATVTGSATVQKVSGQLTRAARLGRTVCLIGNRGLDRADMSESRAYSVVLKPGHGKKKLLEQKVSVKATLQKFEAGTTGEAD